MASATGSIWTRFARSGCPSGWPEAMARRKRSWRRWRLGAAGVQVGTAFAFCEESGLREDYKRALLDEDQARRSFGVHRSASSPTGFPFKAAQLEGTTSEAEVYANRKRVCDIGILREAYRTAERHDRLSLPLRAGKRLCRQGRSV